MRKGTCRTKGREDVIVKTYKEISNIIQKNSAVSVDVVLKKISGLSRSAWYKCVSKGPRRGLVSDETIKKLTEFSGLSEDIFSGLAELNDETKNAFAAKIKEKFGKDAPNILELQKAAENKIKRPYNKYNKSDKKIKKVKAKPGRKPKLNKGLKDEPKKFKAKPGRKPKIIGTAPALVKNSEAKNSLKKAADIQTGLTVGKLKNIAGEIERLNDIKQLENITEVLDKLARITEKKIEFVSAMKAL